MGALHVPHYPEIPGIERFSGPSLHSATWRSDVDLAGKTVAVIGTGANCLKLMRKRNISAMEVRAKSQEYFAANLREHMARTVWQSGGCRSWYQDTHTGENTTLWPGPVIQYFRAMRSVAISEYDL